MKIIIRETREIVAQIITNRSMTLEEAIDCVGEMCWDANDEVMSVEINGTTYDYDDLEIIG